MWLALSVTRLCDTKISVFLDVREYFSVGGYQRFREPVASVLNREFTRLLSGTFVSLYLSAWSHITQDQILTLTALEY
jgi:hypothetical protein